MGDFEIKYDVWEVAAEEGYFAWENGLDLDTDNPYNSNDPRNRAWVEGWRQADYDASEEDLVPGEHRYG